MIKCEHDYEFNEYCPECNKKPPERKDVWISPWEVETPSLEEVANKVFYGGARRTGKTYRMVAKTIERILEGKGPVIFVSHQPSMQNNYIIPMFIEQLEALGVEFKFSRKERALKILNSKIYFMYPQQDQFRLNACGIDRDNIFWDHTAKESFYDLYQRLKR